MYSDHALLLLLLLSPLILFAIHFLSPHLRKSFPPLPIWRGIFWYRWRSLPSKEALSFSPFTGVIFPHKITIRAKSAWFCFLLHFLFMTSMVAWSQYRHSSSEKHNCPRPSSPDWCDWSSQLDLTNYVTIIGTILFILLRILQTHIWYDGLALDVPEASPMIATIIALCVALFMQQTERGIAFGVPLSTGTLIDLTNIARRFHGYLFTTSFLFAFWYHPAEGGIMHSSGFFILIMFLIQGCLMFTTTHLSVIWRSFLEMLVLPHSVLIQWSRSLPNNESWKIFVSGYLTLFLITHLPAFQITFAVKFCIYIAFAVLLCLLYGRNSLGRWSEPAKIPIIYYIFMISINTLLYLPYKVLMLFGYWPESSLEGTIPGGFHPSLVICACIFIISSILLTSLMSEIIESLLRNLAKKTGSPRQNIVSLFEDPSKGVAVQIAKLPNISLEELKKHDKEYDCWIAIHHIVYDVTDFVKFHPGGSKTLLRYGGRDASVGFDSVNRNRGHPAVIRRRMGMFACGVLQ